MVTGRPGQHFFLFFYFFLGNRNEGQRLIKYVSITAINTLYYDFCLTLTAYLNLAGYECCTRALTLMSSYSVLALSVLQKHMGSSAHTATDDFIPVSDISLTPIGLIYRPCKVSAPRRAARSVSGLQDVHIDGKQVLNAESCLYFIILQQ